MSDYSSVRIGKLKLKGEKRKHKKHKSKKQETKEEAEKLVDIRDTEAHGGWHTISKFEQISGSICVEMSAYSYLRALDTGLFILGAPHSPGEAPDPEEVLIAIRVSDTHIALKSGYNKYLSIDNKNRLVGRSDAMGSREQFEPIFQDGKLALLGANNQFLASDEDNNSLIVANSLTAGLNEMLKIRTNNDPNVTRMEREAKEMPAEEKGSLKQCEVNYVKKFQSYQDNKLKVNSDPRANLKRAKTDGKLHEVLLDRRAKMKSDKFCK